MNDATMRISVVIGGEATIVDLLAWPERCPNCEKPVYPRPIHNSLAGQDLDVMMVCTLAQCGRSFLAHYTLETIPDFDGASYATTFVGNSPLHFTMTPFSEAIMGVSASFVEIFHEAEVADQLGLVQVSGPGFRKSLEFLIKDYLIRNCGDPNVVKEIRRKQLGPCIREYVPDSRIKSCAERAAWLGNDETHYERKWDNVDLEDLKRLIQLTANWIQNEVMSDDYLRKMPAGRN